MALIARFYCSMQKCEDRSACTCMLSVQSFLFTSVVEQGLNLIGWYGLNNPIALRKAKIVLYTILAFLSAIGLRCKKLLYSVNS